MAKKATKKSVEVDAKTGRYVKKGTAKKRPATTVTMKVNKPKKK